MSTLVVARPPAHLPGPRGVVLPTLKASGRVIVQLAADSLKEPKRCSTLASSPDHLAAVCALLVDTMAGIVEKERIYRFERECNIAARQENDRLKLELAETRAALAHTQALHIREMRLQTVPDAAEDYESVDVIDVDVDGTDLGPDRCVTRRMRPISMRSLIGGAK